MQLNKVLIIDDSEADQFLASSTIKKFDPNIEIFTAYDGEEALELLDQMSEQPDAIFLDINMPVMDGHEFLKAYSQKNTHAAVVIMLTSSDQTKDTESASAYDFVKKYLTKPLTVDHMQEIKEAL